jgi:DNA-binding MarR family transcriptional regulator
MNENSSSDVSQKLRNVLREFPRQKALQASRDGMRASECEFLGMLYVLREEQGLIPTASEVSSKFNVTPAAVTHILNPLEKRGYVKRSRDPDDRRSVIINLTEKGNQLAEALVRETENRLAGLVEHLGEEDTLKLIELLESALGYLISNIPGEVKNS